MSVNAEWGRLREVVMHRPGIEIDYAMLAPRPFLFERPFRTAIAIEEHEKVVRYLKEAGVKVKLLRDAVLEMYHNAEKFRETFTTKVVETVKFDGASDSVSREKTSFKNNARILDPGTLFNILLIEPSVLLKEDGKSEPDYPSVNSNLPLANLYFMRDQQAVASKGIFFGRMKKKQRQKENEITEFILRALYSKDEDFSKISGSGFFEGGDFMPAGKFSLIGIGNRTDLKGALEFVNSGISDSKEFFIVENPVYDFMEGDLRDAMINMHLDTYFNLVNENLAVTSVELAKKAKGSVYFADSGSAEKGETKSLLEYLTEKDIEVLPLSIAEQMSYSSNFLTLRENQILAVNSSQVLKRLLHEKVFPEATRLAIEHELSAEGHRGMFPKNDKTRQYGIESIMTNISELTGGYGGAHCMTASIRRS